MLAYINANTMAANDDIHFVNDSFDVTACRNTFKLLFEIMGQDQYFNNNGNVLVKAKVVGEKQCLIFPGGHIESHESVVDSVIGEIKEETGLTISDLEFCGIKDWGEHDGFQYIVFLYKTNKYEGYIQSSIEGEVFRMPLEDSKEKETIWHLNMMLDIFCKKGAAELYFNRESLDDSPILK